MRISIQGNLNMQWIYYVLMCVLCCYSTVSQAQNIKTTSTLLSPEQAFSFSVESTQPHQAHLHWKIQPNYYLYQHKFEVQQGTQPIRFELPKAIDQFDENYGHSQVYYHDVAFDIPTQASQHYRVTWQGCAKDRLCYPPQHIEFQTNTDGLVTIQNATEHMQKRFLDVARAAHHADLAEQPLLEYQKQVAIPSAMPTTQHIAQDQKWSSILVQHSLGYSIFLFLGLGVLLAFTPCSLPMLPILTALIVREQKGVKAWSIALTFVMSMAMVYALLGLIASSAGLGFQRWLQQPVTLIAFSLLFVLFALNLFGLFELKLPQQWVNRLDHWQSAQQGGTLVGASVMGIISALLVGPCMTAPLAGILLFISQTQNQGQGALLLFILGVGMGIPLLIASVLGAKALPKVGEWMHQIKIIFAFLMLALSLYFIRSLVPILSLQLLSLLLGLAFIVYTLYRLCYKKDQLKWLYIVLLILVVPYLALNQYQYFQKFNVAQSNQIITWHVAHHADQFQQILADAPKDKAIVIDVYADWCVACQPIEHDLLTDIEVQQALLPYYLIKLDFSHYDASHQALLKQWEILGPPTYLFLDPQQHEIRALRLTGEFKKTELLRQLKKLEEHDADV